MSKMFLALLSASLLILVTGVTEKEIHLANSNTAFGFNLLNIIQDDEGGNVFLSPFSISTALAMTYVGAGGETAKQMAEALQIANYPDALERFRSLKNHLFRDHSGYVLRQANKLYGDHETVFKKPFLNEIKTYFGAPLSKVDFTNDATRWDINAWVEEQTDQKIKDLLQKGDLDGAILVLINAIYFKALWKLPFRGTSTSKMDFNISPARKVEVDMMSQKERFKVGEFPDLPAKMIELVYIGGEVSMYIILPNEVDGLCGIQEALTVEKLKAAVDSMEDKMISLSLPKFELKDRIQLKKYLVKLGMANMFESNADFSKISDTPTAVSAVIHQSFVRVDENGTEAAAATAVVMVRTSLVITEEDIIVDKPFLFFIMDKASRSVLFLGRVVDPTDKEELGPDDYKCEVQRVSYALGQTSTDDASTGHIPVLSVYAAIMAFIFKFI